MENNQKSNSPFEIERLAKKLLDQAILDSRTPPVAKSDSANSNHFSSVNLPALSRPKTTQPSLAKKTANSKSASTLPTTNPQVSTAASSQKLVIIGHGHDATEFNSR